MKSLFGRAKKFVKDKEGVFGLTAVQQFFAIILAIALLAYVIVVIMGTLGGSGIIASSTLSAGVTGETGYINFTSSPYTLAKATVHGFANPVIVAAWNATSIIGAGNYTVSSTGVVTNATATALFKPVYFNYTYNYNTQQVGQAQAITGNTSTGIAGFFSSINPVYAILAILVIILVLVVLVRVVGGGEFGKSSRPQL